MKLLVSHLSALRYWRSANDLDVELAKPCRVRSATGSTSSIKDVRLLSPRELGLIMSEDHPLDILVGDSNSRRQSAELAPHVWTGQIPGGAFARIAQSVYVSSPEFMFLQLAGTLDAVELARLGNELCGTYSLRLGERFTERNHPLTSKAKLAGMVKRAKGLYGAGKANEALRWICDKSASPQETNTLLALCLPKRLEGYGLPLPELNPKVKVGERLREYLNGEYYYPDAMWTKVVRGKRIRITVEYDSHEHHDSDVDAEHTRIRRNEFKTMGFLVTSINRSQMNDPNQFLYAARQIARDLGIWRAKPTITEISSCGDLLRRLAEERIG